MKIGKKLSRNLWNEFHPNITKKNDTKRLIVNEPTGSGTKDDKNNESDTKKNMTKIHEKIVVIMIPSSGFPK